MTSYNHAQSPWSRSPRIPNLAASIPRVVPVVARASRPHTGGDTEARPGSGSPSCHAAAMRKTPLYRPGTRQPRRCMRGTALTSTHHHYRHCCASRRGGPPPPLRPTPAPRHSLHPPAAIRGSKLRRAATHTSYLTTRRSGWAPPARRHEQPHLICICRMVAQSTLFFLTRYFSCCTQAAERCAPRNDCRRRWLDSWRAGGTSAGAVDPTAADCIPTRRAVSVYLVPPAIAPKGVPAVVRLWPLRTS